MMKQINRISDFFKYTESNQASIHLCVGFHTDAELGHQNSMIFYEFSHMLHIVYDLGGYSGILDEKPGNFQLNIRFLASSTHARLIHTADVMTGCILKIVDISL